MQTPPEIRLPERLDTTGQMEAACLWSGDWASRELNEGGCGRQAVRNHDARCIDPGSAPQSVFTRTNIQCPTQGASVAVK